LTTLVKALDERRFACSFGEENLHGNGNSLGLRKREIFTLPDLSKSPPTDSPKETPSSAENLNLLPDALVDLLLE
jgi:hypothetical protein